MHPLLTGFLKIPSCRQSTDSLTKRAASLIWISSGSWLWKEQSTFNCTITSNISLGYCTTHLIIYCLFRLVNCQVCIRAKWPANAYLWFLNDKEYFHSSLDRILLHCRVPPQHLIFQYPFIHLNGERHYETKCKCLVKNTTPRPWKELEAGLLGSGMNALTITL